MISSERSPEWEDPGKPLDESDYGGSLWQLFKAWLRRRLGEASR